ncbi:MAG: hypothetical protein NTAFB05_08110 [Nitrobacter sp.]
MSDTPIASNEAPKTKEDPKTASPSDAKPAVQDNASDSKPPPDGPKQK